MGKHIKKMFTLLSIMKIERTLRLALGGPQFKMTLRFHLTPVRMTNNKITAKHHAEEDIEKEKLSSTDYGKANLCSHFGNQYVSFSEIGNLYLKIYLYQQ